MALRFSQSFDGVKAANDWLTVVDMNGWESWRRQTDEGEVESQQGVVLAGPVVEFSA